MNARKIHEYKRPCALCLSRVGFGQKAIGKALQCAQKVVGRWRTEAGLERRSNRKPGGGERERWSATLKRFNVEKYLREAFEDEQRAIRQADELHWSNHPSVPTKALGYYYAHRAELLPRMRTYAARKYAENPEAKLTKTRAYQRRIRESVAAPYVRKLLTNYGSLRAKDLPPQLVEVKRLHIQLQREVKSK